MQITGLKSPAVTSNSAEALNALKTHPSTTPYRPPGPRPNSGVHRYSASPIYITYIPRVPALVLQHIIIIFTTLTDLLPPRPLFASSFSSTGTAFLLFQEPTGSVPFAVPHGAPEYGAVLEERRSWDPIAFAEKHGLKLAGANYFLVTSPEVQPSE